VTRRILAALGAVVGLTAPAIARPAPAGTGDEYLARLASDVRTRLDAIVAAKAPKLVPPTPVALKWKVVKVGSIDLGAPLVALTAAELDGDRRAGELYAVTAREVIAIGFRHGRVVELGRVAFDGERAVPAPRDVVATVVVEGSEVVAAASPWAKELRVGWSGKSLVSLPAQPSTGFLVCPGERAQLAPGRNHFANATYAVRCRNDLVDRTGIPLQVRAELATNGKLAVTLKRCPPDASCTELGRFEYAKVGVAFEIADVDRNGTPEVIVSEASAPGAADGAKVISLGGDEKKGLFRRSWSGGVAGLVVIDGDDPDDVPEVIAAVRFPGVSRVDVWRLD
jgi:hypothetical protein